MSECAVVAPSLPTLPIEAVERGTRRAGRGRAFQSHAEAPQPKRLAEITARWHNELPEAMRVLERGFTAATQFYAFPEPHWARLRTTNSLERLHTEIKRRIRSAGAFPDRASALRLITAVALRTTALWSERRYLDLSLLEPKEVAKAA